MANPIIQRISRLFKPEVPQTTTREFHPVKPVTLRDLFGVETSRHELVKRCREMYRTDPRVKGSVTTLARDIVRDGFSFEVQGDDPQSAKAAEIAQALIKRIKLESRLSDWIKLAVRDGDLFLELGVGAAYRIEEVTRKPTLQMSRLSDKFDRFADPEKAFAWSDGHSMAWGNIGEEAIYFPEFLIVHSRWDHDSDSRYGTPGYASAVGAWKRVKEGELDLAVRRKLRASIRYYHNVGDGTPDEVEAYREVNEAALNAQNAATDFYGPAEGGISVIEGDPNMGEIRDVMHQIQTMSADLPVPLELLAYGTDLNRDILEDKRTQYQETLSDSRGWVESQIVLPIIEREWLLHGILPAALDYGVTWLSNTILTPGELMTVVQLILLLEQAGWPPDAINRLVGPYLSNDVDLVEIDRMKAEMRQNAAEQEQLSQEEMARQTAALMERLKWLPPTA